MRCAGCGKQFEASGRVASISGRIMGDECTDSYYWCEACGTYTLRMLREIFAGPDTESSGIAIAKEEGDRRLEIIRRCAEPWDERCRCEAHRKYFGDWLD